MTHQAGMIRAGGGAVFRPAVAEAFAEAGARDAARASVGIVRVALLDDVEETAATVAALKARRPDLTILVSLVAADAAAVCRLVEAGADAFVAADAAQDVELDADPGEDRAPAVDGRYGLTAREIEVLRFLGSGFSNKDVARRLDVSVRTVETHRFNLRRKTNAGRLKDLVHLARRMGLPPVGEGAGEPRKVGSDVAAIHAARTVTRCGVR